MTDRMKHNVTIGIAIAVCLLMLSILASLVVAAPKSSLRSSVLSPQVCTTGAMRTIGAQDGKEHDMKTLLVATALLVSSSSHAQWSDLRFTTFLDDTLYSWYNGHEGEIRYVHINGQNYTGGIYWDRWSRAEMDSFGIWLGTDDTVAITLTYYRESYGDNPTYCTIMGPLPYGFYSVPLQGEVRRSSDFRVFIPVLVPAEDGIHNKQNSSAPVEVGRAVVHVAPKMHVSRDEWIGALQQKYFNALGAPTDSSHAEIIIR